MERCPYYREYGYSKMTGTNPRCPSDFGNFFMQKIDKINQLIDMQSSLEMSKAGEEGCADSDTCAGVTFANFKTLSQEQVSELIKKAAKKSCPPDPMPTSVVLEVLDVLLAVITNMINLSILQRCPYYREYGYSKITKVKVK